MARDFSIERVHVAALTIDSALRTVKANVTRLALLLVCVGVINCGTGERVLANDSRLPGWFQLPNGEQRSNVVVRLRYVGPGIDSPYNMMTELTTRTGTGLAQKMGTVAGPFDSRGEKTHSIFASPQFEVVAVEDTTELIEIQSNGNFYVSDDAVLKSKIVAATPRLQAQ